MCRTTEMSHPVHSIHTSSSLVINSNCGWRSDILILHNLPSSRIRTPRHFYNPARHEKTTCSTQDINPDSIRIIYKESLTFVLEELYELFGKPVIDRLHRVRVQEQS